MREAFALQKLLTFFHKNIGIFEILTLEILTKRSLTTSLDLNNRVQAENSNNMNKGLAIERQKGGTPKALPT